MDGVDPGFQPFTGRGHRLSDVPHVPELSMSKMKSVAYSWFLKLPMEDQYKALKENIIGFVEDTTFIISCVEEPITRPPSYETMLQILKSLRERFEILKEDYMEFVLDHINEPVQEPTNTRGV